jgi:hypothetical protein
MFSVADLTMTQLWTLIYYPGLHNSCSNADLNPAQPQVLVMTLFSSGVDNSSDIDSNSSDGGGGILARIPNFEIQCMFRQWANK